MTVRNRRGFRAGSKASALEPVVSSEGVGRWHHLVPVGPPDRFEKSLRVAASLRGFKLSLKRVGDGYLARARHADNIYTPDEVATMDRSTLDGVLLDLGVQPSPEHGDGTLRRLIVAMGEARADSDTKEEDCERDS